MKAKDYYERYKTELEAEPMTALAEKVKTLEDQKSNLEAQCLEAYKRMEANSGSFFKKLFKRRAYRKASDEKIHITLALESVSIKLEKTRLEKLEMEGQIKVAVRKLIGEFVDEVREISKRRGIKTDKALFSILEEQNKKFNALVEMFQHPAIRRNGFRRIICDVLNITEETFIQVQGQNAWSARNTLWDALCQKHNL